jgi:hypothetical protein
MSNRKFSTASLVTDNRTNNFTIPNTRLYTTSSLWFDFDPADINIANNTSISADTTYIARTGQAIVTGGTMTYKTANGGYLDLGSAAGYARIFAGYKGFDDINNATSLSIVCWFQSDRTSRQVLVSRFADPRTGMDSLYQINHIVDPTGDYHYNSSGVIGGASGNLDTNSWSANTWTLSVWTYSVSDGIARWYENNATAVTTVNFGTDSGNGLSVGSSKDTLIGLGTRSDVYETLKGALGPIRIYTKALSTAEIQQEYALNKTRFGLS